MKKKTSVEIPGLVGTCGHLEVVLGFAPASTLCKLSFADVLNDDTGEGYQRPRSRQHSQDFKSYILTKDTSTIPLTFNLRKDLSPYWQIKRGKGQTATLVIDPARPSLAQVDCQHRLGELAELDIPLAFMIFIGLDLRAEMAMFNVINSKAKGLSSSLTDYHQTNLLNDLAAEAPHLYLARKLNEDPGSPWHRLIRYGGETTSGLKRRTSLRMMQRCLQRVLRKCPEVLPTEIDAQYAIVRDYWLAVRSTFPTEWKDHRHNLLTKGIGLYSLSELLIDILQAVPQPVQKDFAVELARLKGRVDWGSKGMFAEAGGHKGAQEVYATLKRLAGL